MRQGTCERCKQRNQWINWLDGAGKLCQAAELCASCWEAVEMGRATQDVSDLGIPALTWEERENECARAEALRNRLSRERRLATKEQVGDDVLLARLRATEEDFLKNVAPPRVLPPDKPRPRPKRDRQHGLVPRQCKPLPGDTDGEDDNMTRAYEEDR